MSETTVVIKTIGRPTLKAAMRSAKREGFRPIVVSDGARVSAQGALKYVKLGKRWGYYGGMAANVGAALAETEFITFLDDDDEFVEGAGDIIRRKLKESPNIDIWIAGIELGTPVDVFDTGLKWIRKGGAPEGTWTSIRSESPGTVLKKESLTLGMSPELGPIAGNVCMPTFRTSIFSKVPFKDCIPEEQASMTDFWHVAHCLQEGFTLDWFKEVIYLVRPIVGGLNGEGL